MSKPIKYKSEKGTECIIKGGVFTGYAAYDKDGNRVLKGKADGLYDHPTDVMKAIDKQESETAKTSK